MDYVPKPGRARSPKLARSLFACPPKSKNRAAALALNPQPLRRLEVARSLLLPPLELSELRQAHVNFLLPRRNLDGLFEKNLGLCIKNKNFMSPLLPLRVRARPLTHVPSGWG